MTGQQAWPLIVLNPNPEPVIVSVLATGAVTKVVIDLSLVTSYECQLASGEV